MPSSSTILPSTDSVGLPTKKFSKAELEQMLAKLQIKRCGTLYDGHEEDALKFVRNCYGKTRSDLLLSARVECLVSQEAV